MTGSASVKIDDFEVLDTARMKNIDGRWETNVGDTLDLAGLRQGQVELDLPTAEGQSSRVVLHYQDPKNFMPFTIKDVAGTLPLTSGGAALMG